MFSSALIEFKRSDLSAADGFEKTSNVFLKPFRLASGRVVEISDSQESPFIDQEKINIIGRIALFIFSFTLWLPFTIIGCQMLLFSTTHDETLERYSHTASGYLPIQEPPARPHSPPPPQAPPPRAHLSPPSMISLIQNDRALAVVRILQEQGMSFTAALGEAESLVFSEQLSSFYSHFNPQRPPRDVHTQEAVVTHFRKHVIQAYNAKILMGLYNLFIGRMGEEITAALFANSSNFPSAVVNNERICSVADLINIIELSDRARQGRGPSPEGSAELRSEFDQIMVRLQSKLLSGEVCPNPRSIFTNFPRLMELVRELQRQGIDTGLPHIVGMGYILSEMRSPSLHLSSNAETHLMRALGLNIARLEERKMSRREGLQERLSREDFIYGHRALMLPNERLEMNGTQLYLQRIALAKRLRNCPKIT